MEDLAINVKDTALILEGGGMRCSYTAGAVVTLLENNINFADIYGISAGSSHSVNYVSRDAARTKASFVDLVHDPEFGGALSMMKGQGYFNAHYLYEGIAERLEGTDSVFSFDFDTFMANPADVHIEGFDCDSGETVYWSKKDMPTLYEMMLRVRAGSSMPLFMPPCTIDERTYLDGGLGSSWGIPLEAAKRDGYEKFFIVRTQPKGYRKDAIGSAASALFKAAFRKNPAVWCATIERPVCYNAVCDEIEALEKSGAAYVFYPEEMNVTNKTADFDELQAAYDAGYAHAQRELPAWKQWLGL